MAKPQIRLSASDSKILHAVFDPESAPEAPRISIDPSLPSDPHISDQSLLSELRKREIAAVRVVEKYAGPNDDQGKHAAYLEAKSLLDAVVAEHPLYASAWNNRAQLRRWRYGDARVLTRKPNAPLVERRTEARQCIINALSDLDRAISLASPPATSHNKAVSPSQGKLLAQAWTQRAAVFWGAAKDLGTSGTNLVPFDDNDVRKAPEWSTWDKTRFEEEGSRCFFMAGLYGSEVGRAMAVLSNPTAKLCGNIVKEAMRRERSEASSRV